MNIDQPVSVTLGFFFLILTGCATSQPRSKPESPPFETKTLNSMVGRVSATHWFRDSSEYQAVTRSIYRSAEQIVDKELVEQCNRNDGGARWAVVMDADETLLDNSIFQVESILRDATYDPKDWNRWVQRGEETTIPGAQEFVDAVTAKCGVIVVVTNRLFQQGPAPAQDECAPTVDRLHTLYGHRGVSPFAAVVCATTNPTGATTAGPLPAASSAQALPKCSAERKSTDKNARFDEVAAGLVSGIGPVDIKMYIGDSITDFPAFCGCNAEEATTAKAGHWGVDYFALPNPTYGGWLGCPARTLSSPRRG